jgi:hypothetical protein
MKVRHGWVSNSSSTSFVVVGVILDSIPDVPDWSSETEVKAFEEKFTPEYVEKVRKGRDMEEAFDDFGLVLFYDDEGDYYVGVEPDMKDDETWGAYKDQVKAQISKVLRDPDIKVNIHGGSMYS